MGTVGGDLLQRPRWWYYRAGFGLLARDDKGQPLVPNGDNRYHAIFGNDGPANFVSPSSLAPALIALGAKLQLHGPSGAREVTVEEFFVIPKSENEREHAIKPNEILAEIVIPPPAPGSRSVTSKCARGRRSIGRSLPRPFRSAWTAPEFPRRASFSGTWRRFPGARGMRKSCSKENRSMKRPRQRPAMPPSPGLSRSAGTATKYNSRVWL
jgi:hypothetical protein